MSEGDLNKFWLDRLRASEENIECVDTLNLIGAAHQAQREGDTEWERKIDAVLRNREERA